MFRILRFFGECVNKKERSSDSDFHTIFNISYGVKKADRMDRIAEKRYNDCAKRNPARIHRAAPLRGDYTGNPRLAGKMPPAASLSPLRTWYNDFAQYDSGKAW